jgi:Holliday junction resolvase
VSTGPEARLRKRIADALKARGWRVLKWYSSPYSEAGIPDLLAMKQGHALWVEVKTPGKQPTALQAAKLAELRSAGCTAFVADSLESFERAYWEQTGAGLA